MPSPSTHSILELSAAEAERAADLHRSSVVIDTAAPSCAPGAFTEAMVAALVAAVAAGGSAGELIGALERIVDEALMKGEHPDFWSLWDQAGVDVASITVGVFGRRPFTHENAVADLARWVRRFDRLPELIRVTRASDIVRSQTAGTHGVLLHLANAALIGEDIDQLVVLRDLGVGSMQLTYNARNLIGDGCAARRDGGLSTFGVDVLHAMNDLGILVDLAHSGDQTTLDAIELAHSPCAITHSSCRTLVDIPRAVGDDVLRAIGQSGGYFGVLVTPFTITIDEAPTLDVWLRHVHHAAEIAGIENIGIGTDWGVTFPQVLVDRLNAEMLRPGFRPSHAVDWGASLPGFSSWADWPNLTQALVADGFNDEEIRGLIGGNFQRVFSQVSP